MSKKLSLSVAAKQLGSSADELSLLLEPGVKEVSIDQLEHLAAQLAAKKNTHLIVSKQNELPDSQVKEITSNVTEYIDAGLPLPSLDVVAARAFFDQYRHRRAEELGRRSADAVFDAQVQERVIAEETNDQYNSDYLNELESSTQDLLGNTKELIKVKQSERIKVSENLEQVVQSLPTATQQLLKHSVLYKRLFP